jgi:RNA polymerase sigma factor (sigma-70 family)
MLGNPADAADLTQEILVKVITALSSFKKKSSFRTWLYRIVKNDVINREKKRKRENILSFREFGNKLDNAPDRELSLTDNFGPDQKLLVEETKIRCMSGMLLCLDIKQRLIFILGELFEVSDTIGSEIMGISKANFRVLLSRAKEQLYNFMNEKCGLENKSNPCRCARKTKAFIDAGIVDPRNLLFAKEHIRSIESIAGEKQYQMENLLQENYQRLYRQHPFLEPPDLSAHLREFLASERVAVTFNLTTNKNSLS